jgi:outer membrane biosynthesis protein TonB
MYRVIAIIGATLLLAACSSTDFSSFKNPFHFEPEKDTIRFESQPPGALVRTSTDQSCMTPCALAMPADKPFTVTYTLNGYQPDTEQVEMTSMGDGTSKLRPNPVLVELTPTPPPPKPKKVYHRRHTAKPKPKPKPVARKPAPKAAPKPAAAPPMAPAEQPQVTSPWPSAPAQSNQE